MWEILPLFQHDLKTGRITAYYVFITRGKWIESRTIEDCMCDVCIEMYIYSETLTGFACLYYKYVQKLWINVFATWRQQLEL